MLKTTACHRSWFVLVSLLSQQRISRIHGTAERRGWNTDARRTKEAIAPCERGMNEILLNTTEFRLDQTTRGTVESSLKSRRRTLEYAGYRASKGARERRRGMLRFGYNGQLTSAT